MTAAGNGPRIAGFPLLYVAMFVMATGNLAMISLFPAIARSSGIPDVAMVAVQSVSAGLSILAMPYWAARSDRIGRKQVILIGIAGFTLASALTAGAIFAAVHRLVPVVAGVAALIGSRAVFGSVGLASAPAIQAHIADETLPGQRTEALASIYSAQGLGSIVGPGVAPFLILPWVGLSGPLITFTIIGALVLVAAAWRLPRTGVRVPAATDRPRGKWATLRLSSVWPFVAYLAVLSGCQAASLQMLGFVVIDRLRLAPLAAQPLAGAAMMLGAAAAVTVQLGIMRLIRASPNRLMLAGGLLMVLGNVVMAVAGSYALVVLAFIMTSAGGAFGMPAAASGASLANTGDSQGAVAGMTSAALGSGLLIAPVIAMIIYRHSDAAAFLGLAAALVIALMALLPRVGRCLATAVPNSASTTALAGLERRGHSAGSIE
jgi:MFS family permease